jgi:hypothetical protein
MSRPRFSIVSAAAMVLATAIAAIAMLSYDGGGFYGSRGFPFAWYRWSDVFEIGTPNRGVSWIGLVADLMFWLTVITATGFTVERMVRRFFRGYANKNAVKP